MKLEIKSTGKTGGSTICRNKINNKEVKQKEWLFSTLDQQMSQIREIRTQLKTNQNENTTY